MLKHHHESESSIHTLQFSLHPISETLETPRKAIPGS
jgi:hypothetical protein